MMRADNAREIAAMIFYDTMRSSDSAIVQESLQHLNGPNAITIATSLLDEYCGLDMDSRAFALATEGGVEHFC